MRWWPRSTTNKRRSALIAMLCTVLNSFGPGFAGSFGGPPQSLMNSSFGPNFATRVPP
jgi:hypothetical protein